MKNKAKILAIALIILASSAYNLASNRNPHLKGSNLQSATLANIKLMQASATESVCQNTDGVKCVIYNATITGTATGPFVQY